METKVKGVAVNTTTSVREHQFLNQLTEDLGMGTIVCLDSFEGKSGKTFENCIHTDIKSGVETPIRLEEGVYNGACETAKIPEAKRWEDVQEDGSGFYSSNVLFYTENKFARASLK